MQRGLKVIQTILQLYHFALQAFYLYTKFILNNDCYTNEIYSETNGQSNS